MKKFGAGSKKFLVVETGAKQNITFINVTPRDILVQTLSVFVLYTYKLLAIVTNYMPARSLSAIILLWRNSKISLFPSLLSLQAFYPL